MQDKKLAELVKNGDMAAFEELCGKFEHKIINIAYGMLSDYEDAKDASQEVFVKIYKNIGNFRGESALSTWIYRICKNVCTDFLRKRKDAAKSLDSDKENGVENEPFDLSKSPERLAEQHEAKRLVREALSELDEDSRLIITMSDLAGMSYEEIAMVFVIPIGTVKSRLFRAREKLKKILWKNREHFL